MYNAHLNDNIARPIYKCMSDYMFTCRAYSVHCTWNDKLSRVHAEGYSVNS